MLVSYHVVGPAADSGLGVSYPHVLRASSDFLLDLRMPIFAFLAGYIYAIRPPRIEGYVKFVRGKFLRVFLPGMVAAALFLIVSNAMGTGFARPLTEAWRVFVLPYAHFWFLQSICVIFVVYGLFDALTSHRFALLVFVVALIVHELRPFPWFVVLSWNGVTYLFPYFLLGVLCLRHKTFLLEHAGKIAAITLIGVVLSIVWNMRGYLESGGFFTSKRDVQSVVMGMGTTVFALLCLPRIRVLELIRPYALTIYLYHVFATSFARRLSEAAGVESIWLQWVFGIGMGVFLPIALHEVVARFPALIRRPVLGR